MKKLIPGFVLPTRAGVAQAASPVNIAIIAEDFMFDLRFERLAPALAIIEQGRWRVPGRRASTDAEHPAARIGRGVSFHHLPNPRGFPSVTS
jgi:hypothetical protein